jgi:hypothetical protein
MKKITVKLLHDAVRVAPAPLEGELLRVEGVTEENLEEVRRALDGMDHGPSLETGVVLEHGHAVRSAPPGRIVLYRKGDAITYPSGEKDEKGKPINHALVPERSIVAVVHVSEESA